MTIPQFVVRPAVESDRSIVHGLDDASALEGRNFRGADALDISLGEFDTRWPLSGLRDDTVFHVVCERSDIVGFASLVLSAMPKPLLTRIYVTPKARGLGAGATLLHAVLDEAKRRGHSGIDAVSLPGDRETKNLYERQGMKARLIIASNEM